MAKKRLGRGLSAIIETAADEVKVRIDENGRVVQILISDIIPNPDQPRKDFNEKSIQELSVSIRQYGLMQPIIVSKEKNKYLIIAGERRYRACSLLGMKKIDAIVRDYEKEKQLELALIENIQREDLNPIEIADTYSVMMNRFQLTQKELSERVGQDRATIANMIRLLSLPVEVKDSVSRGTLSMGHARALLRLKNTRLIKQFAANIVKHGWSVRETEDRVKKNVSRETNDSAVKEIERKDPNIKKLEDDLIKKLGTKVDIQYKGKKGKIVIHFYSLDDLDRIIEFVES